MQPLAFCTDVTAAAGAGLGRARVERARAARAATRLGPASTSSSRDFKMKEFAMPFVYNCHPTQGVFWSFIVQTWHVSTDRSSFWKYSF